MKYEYAADLQQRMVAIVVALGMDYVDVSRVKCYRSYGSSTKRTIARVHTIGKLMQKAMGVEAWYAIEFLEKFDKMNEEEKDKVIIHELMHIPKTFGGGFHQHDYVCEKNVEIMYERYVALRTRIGSEHLINAASVQENLHRSPGLIRERQEVIPLNNSVREKEQNDEMNMKEKVKIDKKPLFLFWRE